jgi:hypothetical protein
MLLEAISKAYSGDQIALDRNRFHINIQYVIDNPTSKLSYETKSKLSYVNYCVMG